MEIIGWIMALVIGITLGLLGGGGSILTVPVLVYLFDLDVVVATGYSLFIVGFTSLFGAVKYYNKKLIDLKMVSVFGSASLVAVYLARNIIVPSIPGEIYNWGEHVLTRQAAIMMLFAVMMLFASYSMIFNLKKQEKEPELRPNNYLFLIIQGFVIGILVGLVGAGGGFLIIPALVTFGNMRMKTAVGTSLSIIAINSLIGFLGDPMSDALDAVFLLSFSTLAVVGIFVGMKLSEYVPNRTLKPVFGWFILIMGIYILGKEILF